MHIGLYIFYHTVRNYLYIKYHYYRSFCNNIFFYITIFLFIEDAVLFFESYLNDDYWNTQPN